MKVTNQNFNIIKSQYKPVFGQAQKSAPVVVDEAEFLSHKQKTAILASSTAGMVAGLAVCGRRQGLNIFKWNDFTKLKIESLEILGLATGSLVGGLLGGVAVDKTNKRDKIRESLQQFVGNIIFPVSFVVAGNACYDYLSKKFNWKMPEFNNKILTAISKSSPAVLVTAGALAAGILTGNKVANKMNNEIFNEEESRDIKISDFAAHVDDTLLGATLVAQNLAPSGVSAVSGASSSVSAIGSVAARLIPPALVVPGYVAGTAQ